MTMYLTKSFLEVLKEFTDGRGDFPDNREYCRKRFKVKGFRLLVSG
jgi:hypothetical protein